MTILAVMALIYAGIQIVLWFVAGILERVDGRRERNRLAIGWAAVSALFFIASRLPT